MGDGEAAEADDEELARVLEAMQPDEREAALLRCIEDHALRDKLLFSLLRAPVGASVHVQVSARMNESDGFCPGGSLREILSSGSFEEAILRREGDGEAIFFALSCEACPHLERTYAGDDIEDKLLQYFAKELIRFPEHQVLCLERS